MARQGVSLVIRPGTVEVIQAVQGLQGIRVTHATRVSVKGSDDAHMVEAISTALDLAHVKTRSGIGVCLAAQDVLLRFFTIPLLPKPEWTNAIQFEARKYVPFKTSDLIWCYQAVEQRAASQLAVVFTAIRKDAFERLQGWLSQADVQATFIEGQSSSLARAVANVQSARSAEVVAAIDVDEAASVAHVIILKGDLLYLARDINLTARAGGEPALMEPSPEAAAPTVGEGAASFDQGSETERAPETASSNEDHRVERLLGEIRLSLDFFAREHPGLALSRVVLFGDAHTVQPWSVWLSEQLHCPVEVGALPLATPRGQSMSLEYASALGTMLRQFKPAPTQCNFLVSAKSVAPRVTVTLSRGLNPQEARVILKAMTKPLAIQSVVAAIGLGVLWYVVRQNVATAHAQLAAAKQQQHEMKWKLDARSQEELAALQQQAQQRIGVLRGLVDDRVIVTEKLDALARALPDGIWLEGFRYDNRFLDQTRTETSLTIRGACFLPEEKSTELSVIGEFTSRVRRDPRFFNGFTSAQLGEISVKEDNPRYTYRTFKLNCSSSGKRL